jgi:hypothetical protein
VPEYSYIISVYDFTDFLRKYNSRKLKKKKIPTEISKVAFYLFWVSGKHYEKVNSKIYSRQKLLSVNIIYACDLHFCEEFSKESSIILG